VSASKLFFVVRERDENSGKYTQEYPDNEFIEAIESLDFPSTAEIADEVGCSYTLAYHRLNSLADEGEIKRLEIGNSFAWTQ